MTTPTATPRCRVNRSRADTCPSTGGDGLDLGSDGAGGVPVRPGRWPGPDGGVRVATGADRPPARRSPSGAGAGVVTAPTPHPRSGPSAAARGPDEPAPTPTRALAGLAAGWPQRGGTRRARAGRSRRGPARPEAPPAPRGRGP